MLCSFLHKLPLHWSTNLALKTTGNARLVPREDYRFTLGQLLFTLLHIESSYFYELCACPARVTTSRVAPLLSFAVN